MFELAQRLPSSLRLPLEILLDNKKSNGRADQLGDILDELSDSSLEKDVLENVSKCLLFVYRTDLRNPCLRNESVIDEVEVSPLNEILDRQMQLRPSDKSTQTKNYMRVLAEFVAAKPNSAYKILVILYQMAESIKQNNSRFTECGRALYKNLAHYRNLKIDAQLIQDLKRCAMSEYRAVPYVGSIMYNWYNAETIGCTDILHTFISSFGASELFTFTCKATLDDITLFEEESVVSVLTRTLEWQSWEQHCVWTLVEAHRLSVDTFLPLLSQLDSRNNPEAVNAMFLILKKQKPNQDIVGSLLCRKPSSMDPFVISLLVEWSRAYTEEMSEVIAAVLVRASGSPVKRKRGPTGSRGTSSPAGPPTPTVENVLSYLDQLRAITEEGIFTKDIMQAALLQVQSWVTETQRIKYKDLLSLAAEEPDAKEYRSSLKRGGTTKKLPLSPNSSQTFTSSSVVSSSGSGVSSSQLSRTRSGHIRAPRKDESSGSSEEEDDLPRPKKLKTIKRRTPNVLNSDSD